MNTDLSDEELVLEAREKETAVNELVARYISTVEAMANRFSPEVSDDLKQEGLMALLSAVKSFKADKGVNFSAYLAVCVKNRMLTYLKRNSKGAAEDISADELEELIGISDGDIPDNILVEQERMEELYSRISSALSPLEWKVFRLFITGMSFEAIAQRVGVDRKAADNAMQRVRRKLKTLLK